VSRLRRVPAFLLAAALVASVLAQYELDSNLLAGGSGRNTRVKAPAVSRQIYSVNYKTGDFAYNRASAFNDPTYNIYQRYTFDRFNRTGAASVQARSNVAGMRVGQANVSALRPRSGGGKSAHHSNHALASTKYRASGRGGRAPSLKQPSYRVRGGKW